MNFKKLSPVVIALATSMAPAAGFAFTVSGSAVAVAGNNGNVRLTTPTVTGNVPGTFSSGQITGPTGNKATANFTTSVGPTPFISMFAEGSDGAGVNAALGFAQAKLTYTFLVPSTPGVPLGTPVPIDFEGLTFSHVLFAGDPAMNFNDSGTRLILDETEIAHTIHDIGSIGTQPTVVQPFNGPASEVRIGWGADAAVGSPPREYSDFFRFQFMASAGDVVGVTLNGFAQGSLTGTLHPLGIPTAGNTSVFLDPHFFIDPAFIALHPGISIQLEPGVGNGAPVPLPIAAWSFASALVSLCAFGRRQSKHGAARITISS